MSSPTNRPSDNPSHAQDAALSDESLLRRVARQDRAAYELFYRRHAGQVYGLILRIVKDQAVADEVLQETFWQVWERAEQFQGDGKATAWLFQVARNRSLDQLRRQKARPQRSHPGADDEETLAQIPDVEHHSPEAELWQSLRHTHVQGALAALPDEQRICIELAYFDGLTQQQIAAQTGSSLGTIKSRMRLGLEKLEHQLRGQGYP